MSTLPAKQVPRPKDLEWLSDALHLPEADSQSPALESLLASLPSLNLELWPARRAVVSEGERGEDFFVVYKGALSVWRRAGRSPARELGRLKPGDFFGEIGFLMKAARAATVRTETECRLFRFPAAEFARLLERHQNLESRVRLAALLRVDKIFCAARP